MLYPLSVVQLVLTKPSPNEEFANVLNEDGIVHSDKSVLVLVDFDNVFGAQSATDFEWISLEINKMLQLALKVEPDLTRVDLRFYGDG